MDYDDSDFQDHNLNLVGEANNKFSPVLHPYALPKFDFDDTLNTHLRFDSLGESEAFLGIEGNVDNNWIEDFSRGSSHIVFSSGATASCAISRHNDVWSEATSSESVEMLLNSVGQDEVIVRENTVKKSETYDELGCTMEPMEPGQTSHEESLPKEETMNLQPISSANDTLGESFLVKTDDGQEHVLVKDDSPTTADEAPVEENYAFLVSNTAAVEAVDTTGFDKIVTEITDNVLDQEEDKADAKSRMVDDCSDETNDELGCTMEPMEPGQTSHEKSPPKEEMMNLQPNPSVDDTPGESFVVNTDDGQEQVLVKDESPTSAEEAPVEENNVILASNTAALEAVDTAGFDKIVTETTDNVLDHAEDKASTKSRMGDDCSDETNDEIGCTMEPMDPGQTSHEKSLPKEEMMNLQPNPSVDDTPGESFVVNTDDGQEQGLVKDESPTSAEEAPVEKNNVILSSNTAAVEAVDTAGFDKIATETTDNLLDQAEDKASTKSRMEDDCSDGTAQTVISDSGQLNNQDTLLPETSNDENVISDYIQSSYNRSDITLEAQSDLGETHSDIHIDPASEVENVETENIGTTAKPDVKEIGLSDVTILERGDQALSTLQVGGQDVSGIQCQNLPIGSVHISGAVEASLELAGELATIKDSVSIEKPDSLSHQHMEVITSEHESTFQMETETHTQIHVAETSESVYVSPMDSMVESIQGGDSKKSDNNEGRDQYMKSVELLVNANDRDQYMKSSQMLSESMVSESVGYVSGGSASKLAESESHSDTLPTENSGTMVDGSLNSEELQPPSQDGAPAVSLTSSIHLHIVKTSIDASDQGNFSEIEKVSSGEPENGQTMPPVDASSSGSEMDQQATKHAEDIEQNTHFVESCPVSELSKDAIDADAAGQAIDADAAGQAIDADAGQVLQQRSEETILQENLVTEVVKVHEKQAIQDMDNINEKHSTSSLASHGIEAGKDGREEDNTAAAGGTPVSHSKGDAIVPGDSCSSKCSESSVKSHVTTAADAGTNLKATLNSYTAVKTSELQLNKTETNSVKKPEDQIFASFMPAGSPVLERNETFSSEMNLTPDQMKAGGSSKTIVFSQATLVSSIVVGSPPISSLEKTAAKSSKAKSERKPRRTAKSVGKETPKKRTSVKGATPYQQFQNGGKSIAVNQSLACPIQITQSTEKQLSLQSPGLRAFGTVLTPTASLPDLNSSGLSNILHRPFTDLQQLQLRAQIFVYGALIQGTAPDEAYMISAFGGPSGGKGSWEKAWRVCAVRAQKSLVATPQTPLQSRAGKTETPSAGGLNSKESSVTKPMIPLSSPLWSSSTSLDNLQSSSVPIGAAVTHQPLLFSSHADQTPPTTKIVGHNSPWVPALPPRSPWFASQQTSGFDVGSCFPVYPITEPVKLTPMKESSFTYSGSKHVQSGISSNVFEVTPTLEPTSTVVAPAQHSTGTKSRKRKKMPVSVESGPSILNSLKQAELAASPFVSVSTAVPITFAPPNLGSNTGTIPNVVSTTAVPINLVSAFPEKKMKSSLPSPVFGGNLVHEVKQRSVLSEDTIDKLKEANMHAEDASALATAAVSHSEYVWKQIEHQRHAGLPPETQDRLALAAVAVATAAAVAKAAAAAANVAANAALQAQLMAEEASPPNASVQGLPKSFPGLDRPASILKGEGAVVSSSSVLIGAREAAKKRVEAATAATKHAENMDSIVKAAELASEAVSQAGILVSMGHPPVLNKLVEAGPSNYWRQTQGSQEVQPSKTVVLEKETVAASEGTFASRRTVQNELGGSAKTGDSVSGPVSATEKNKSQKGCANGKDLDKNNDVVFGPEVGSKLSIDTQSEIQLSMKATNNEDIKEGSNVEVFKEEPGLKTAWYSANVLSIEDDKAYVVFNDLSVEQDKLKDWVALKGKDGQAPKIRTARSVTAMPYEGTRKRRRAAIGDHVWKIGDRVDSWVHDSWWEGVVTEKNNKDENTVTVHFPTQGESMTIKAWNLRPSLVWKDGKWIECSSSGGNIGSSYEGDTPKEKRPRLGTPALVAEVKDTSMKIADDPCLGRLPQSGVLELSFSDNTFNIGRSTGEENKPDPLRTKRTGLQKQGSKGIFGVPKPGKKTKFMDVSKHYISEASTKTQEWKEPAKSVKSTVPSRNFGIGSWRMPSKTNTREKQTTISKPKTFKPASKPKEKPGAAARIIPRKDTHNTTASDLEYSATDGAKNKGFVSGAPFKGTVEEQATSSSQDIGYKTSSSSTNKSKMAPTAGRLPKIEERKALAENSSKTSEGMEPRRSIRRIQPTSRLLEGIQTSMMTSKIPSGSHNKSHQSQSKK